MNRIRAIVHLSFRGYRTNRGGRSSAKRTSRLGEMTMPTSEMFSKNFAVDDGDDHEDIDQFESDFQNVAAYDKMHEREMEIKKLKLKTQIVKRKYFRSEDPAMLTWAEKDQIRLLHDKDPEQWSEDRLCESFPATREVILKVLRSRWTPKSVNVVTKYDEAVKKNWDLYKAGKLIVSAELRVRLAKFKDRKIEPMDPEEIARRILKPKPVFAKPKSTMFSNIIQSYLDANPESRDDEDYEKMRKNSTTQSVKQIAGGESITDYNRTLEVTELEKLSHEKSVKEPLTFKEFLKNRVENIEECKMSPVDRVLVDEYKQRKTESYKAESFVFESESPVGATRELEELEGRFEKIILPDERPETQEKTEVTKVDLRSTEMPEDTDLMGFDRITGVGKVRKENRKEDKDLTIVDKGGLETGIIARHKKHDSLHSEYPEYIKIPAKKYKQGVTYRVEDRYYDDDGEFLYRVTGLKS